MQEVILFGIFGNASGVLNYVRDDKSDLGYLPMLFKTELEAKNMLKFSGDACWHIEKVKLLRYENN